MYEAHGNVRKPREQRNPLMAWAAVVKKLEKHQRGEGRRRRKKAMSQ